jgi:hypothetical protein
MRSRYGETVAARAPRKPIRWSVLIIRWVPPLLMILGAVAFILLGHGHIGDIKDQASGSVFTSIPTDKRSLFSALGVSLIIFALMWLLLVYFIHLNSTDGADRDADEAARDYYSRTGRWPGEPSSHETNG